MAQLEDIKALDKLLWNPADNPGSTVAKASDLLLLKLMNG
ncbi:MAG: hypothetical protein ACJAST_003107 [Halopseudomonas sp.]|jgi:hypothetical protein